MPSQNRHDLTASLNLHELRDASTLVASQLTETITSSQVFPDRKDYAMVNASDGAVSISLPLGSDEIIGLPWKVRKLDNSSNAAGLACSGSDTFADTTTTLTTTTEGAEVGAMWDGTYWRPLASASAGAPVSAPTLAATTAVTVGGTGTGNAAAEVNINKTAAGTGSLNIKVANTLRASAQLDGSENLKIALFDTDGVTEVGSISIAVSTGLITLSKGTTVSAGGFTIAGGALKLDLASTVAYADDAAAAVGGVPVGGVYRTASALKIRAA